VVHALDDHRVEWFQQDLLFVEEAVDLSAQHDAHVEGVGVVVIRKNCRLAQSCGVSVKTVFVMEAAQDWRCRDSAAGWNGTAVYPADGRGNA
jgi:hypothetical protein